MMVTITALLAGDPTDHLMSGAVPLLVVLWIWILLMNDIRRLRDHCLVLGLLVPRTDRAIGAAGLLLLVPGVQANTIVCMPPPRAPVRPRAVLRRARLDAYHEQLFNADGTFNRDGLFDD